MVFCAADQGGPAGSSENAASAAAAKTAKAEPAPAKEGVVDYKAKLLTLLGLDDTADAAAIDAKIAEHSTTMSGVGDLQTKASTADQLQTQYDDLQKQYAELNLKQEQIWKEKQAAEADEILKVYEGHFTDDASKAAIRNILLSDKDAGIAILNGLKKPEAAAAVDKTGDKGTPPSPQHDPNADPNATMTDDEKVAQQNALIKEIRGDGKFTDYEGARAEARRRKPELFS